MDFEKGSSLNLRPQARFDLEHCFEIELWSCCSRLSGGKSEIGGVVAKPSKSVDFAFRGVHVESGSSQDVAQIVNNYFRAIFLEGRS